MIVIGAATHKRSHTVAAVAAPTGELIGGQTVPVGRRGFGALCSGHATRPTGCGRFRTTGTSPGHWSGFLIERGESVLRIPTHLTAKARKSTRQRGKSDPIDALNVARAALQEGFESFPMAHLDGPELDLRLPGALARGRRHRAAARHRPAGRARGGRSRRRAPQRRARRHGDRIRCGRAAPVPGLRDLEGVWGSREATGMKAVPRRLLVLGGGAVELVDLAQAVRRLGGEVALIDRSAHVLALEPAALGEALGEVLRRDGIELVLGARATAARRAGEEYVLELDDGRELRGDRLLVATGRRPRVAGLGLETVGIEADGHGIPVDAHLRAGERLWAIGDVTGIWPLTHVGKYQGRVAAANILGKPREANYEAVPRVVSPTPSSLCGRRRGPLQRHRARGPGGYDQATYTRAYDDSNPASSPCSRRRTPHRRLRGRPGGGRVAPAGDAGDPRPRAAGRDVRRHPAVPDLLRGVPARAPRPQVPDARQPGLDRRRGLRPLHTLHDHPPEIPMLTAESQLTAPNRTIEAANGVTYAYRRFGDARAARRRCCSCSTSAATSTTGTPRSSTRSPPTARSSCSTTPASADRAAPCRAPSPTWPTTRCASSTRSA